MAGRRGPIEKFLDALKDALSGALSPQHDPIPVPVRDDPRRPRR
ncbi:hypothetical protein [Jannaschia sp. LMIT008]|nr:hypothetical protein [Jannaschia sp. LMIT008]